MPSNVSGHQPVNLMFLRGMSSWQRAADCSPPYILLIVLRISLQIPKIEIHPGRHLMCTGPRITIKCDKVYPSSGIRAYYIAYDTTEACDYIAANKQQVNIKLTRTGAIGQSSYAQVLGLFRLHARKDCRNVERLDVMWAQYYAVVDENSIGGRCNQRLQLPTTTHESYNFFIDEILAGDATSFRTSCRVGRR